MREERWCSLSGKAHRKTVVLSLKFLALIFASLPVFSKQVDIALCVNYLFASTQKVHDQVVKELESKSITNEECIVAVGEESVDELNRVNRELLYLKLSGRSKTADRNRKADLEKTKAFLKKVQSRLNAIDNHTAKNGP